MRRYGYVFAAAEAKLKHILTEGVVVYPDEIGAGRLEEPYAAYLPSHPHDLLHRPPCLHHRLLRRIH